MRKENEWKSLKSLGKTGKQCCKGNIVWTAACFSWYKRDTRRCTHARTHARTPFPSLNQVRPSALFTRQIFSVHSYLSCLQSQMRAFSKHWGEHERLKQLSGSNLYALSEKEREKEKEREYTRVRERDLRKEELKLGRRILCSRPSYESSDHCLFHLSFFTAIWFWLMWGRWILYLRCHPDLCGGTSIRSQQ